MLSTESEHPSTFSFEIEGGNSTTQESMGFVSFIRPCALALIIGSTKAFHINPSLGYSRIANCANGAAARFGHKLSDVDLMAIENVAELCLQAESANLEDNECDLDEREALINQLTEQREILLDQVEYMDTLLGRLQGEGRTNGDRKTT